MSMGNDSQPFVFTDDVVNDVIDRLQKENKQLRDKLVELAGRLNAMRADVESTLWPRSGCAQVNEAAE